MLSRLPVKSEEFFACHEHEDVLLVELTEDVPLDLRKIVQRTRECGILRPLFDCLQGLKTHPKNFWKADISEFTIVNGAIFRGHRVVIPVSCRPEVLMVLHEGHFGPNKMKELARRYVWWETLSSDIEKLARNCMICAEHARQPPKTFHPWEHTKNPFDRVHIDYAGPIDGQYLFILVDAHTKWMEVFISSAKTSQTTIKHLREVIARFGLPRTLVSDNDPSFSSNEFNEFCRSNGILHKTTPPYHPASNGQVERYVQTTKQALKKIKAGGERDLHTALQRFLFLHRMVKNSSTDKTPAEAMIGRQLHSRLDLLCEQPQAAYIPSKVDKFMVGNNVMVRSYHGHRKWIPGVIVKLCGTKVALVKLAEGTWKRHFNQLRRMETDSDESHAKRFDESINPALLVPDNAVEIEASPASTDEDQVDLASFEDAVESFEDTQNQLRQEPRRSSRSTAGKGPSRYSP